MRTIFSKITLFLRLFARDDRAITAIEYALIGSLIAIAIITAVKLVGTKLVAAFNVISAAL
jgi:pilus assembly protein Flp/PilA